MSEAQQRQVVIGLLRRFDAISVENPAYPGTPDVNYVEGWIELKHKDRWPKRDGILEVDHYTPQQKVWGIKRKRKKGRIHVLLQVGQEWLLFQPDVAAKYLGKSNRETLIAVAQKVWHHGIKDNKREFIEELFK